MLYWLPAGIVKRRHIELCLRVFALRRACSESQVRVMSDISNTELKGALQQPRPEWSRVRWVNVQVRRCCCCWLSPALLLQEHQHDSGYQC